jgi:hypothetical protein
VAARPNLAIRPTLFVDDGPVAYEALKVKIAAEKAAKAAAKRAAKTAGLPIPEEEDE